MDPLMKAIIIVLVILIVLAIGGFIVWLIVDKVINKSDDSPSQGSTGGEARTGTTSTTSTTSPTTSTTSPTTSTTSPTTSTTSPAPAPAPEYIPLGATNVLLGATSINMAGTLASPIPPQYQTGFLVSRSADGSKALYFNPDQGLSAAGLPNYLELVKNPFDATGNTYSGSQFDKPVLLRFGTNNVMFYWDAINTTAGLSPSATGWIYTLVKK